MNAGSGLPTFALVAVLVVVLSLARIEVTETAGSSATGPLPSDTLVPLDDAGGAPGPAAVAQGSNRKAGSRPTQGPAAAPDARAAGPQGAAGAVDQAVGSVTPAGIECAAGKNGGATAPGVTATEIKLATTAALDGTAKSLLAPSVTSIQAVFDKVNQQGGICGRRLSLRVDNDGFDFQRGQQIIRNYAESGDVFALPVVPSAEGLGAAITGGVINEAGLPVVGTDGMRKEQYDAGGQAKWVWPIATATTSTMRIMVERGRSLGAKTYAIVYDQKYAFGVEGKDKFVEHVKATGGSLVTSFPLNPDNKSFGNEVNGFNEACGGGKCDMVAFLLLPDTAKNFFAKKPEFGALYTSGAQTLFTDDFAKACVSEMGSRCNDFEVWTGYNPPIGALATKAGVARYVTDVRAKDSGIDVNNQFVQGAYVGATLFVEALKKVGPNLTRDNLRAVLDSMTLESDLTSPLVWSAGNHRANTSAQSFAMAVSQNTFQGWAPASGFLKDPSPGAG